MEQTRLVIRLVAKHTKLARLLVERMRLAVLVVERIRLAVLVVERIGLVRLVAERPRLVVQLLVGEQSDARLPGTQFFLRFFPKEHIQRLSFPAERSQRLSLGSRWEHIQ